MVLIVHGITPQCKHVHRENLSGKYSRRCSGTSAERNLSGSQLVFPTQVGANAKHYDDSAVRVWNPRHKLDLATQTIACHWNVALSVVDQPWERVEGVTAISRPPFDKTTRERLGTYILSPFTTFVTSEPTYSTIPAPSVHQRRKGRTLCSSSRQGSMRSQRS